MEGEVRVPFSWGAVAAPPAPDLADVMSEELQLRNIRQNVSTRILIRRDFAHNEHRKEREHDAEHSRPRFPASKREEDQDALHDDPPNCVVDFEEKCLGFVTAVGSVYVGYTETFIGILIGAGFAFLDGLIGGLLIGFFYNIFARCTCCSKKSEQK